MKCQLITTLVVVLAVTTINALPVTKTGKSPNDIKGPEASPAPIELETALEYERYLKEVVEALESDQEFRKKLDQAQEVDIRSGKIAQELDYVNHHVRNKLDEIKRRELERLRALANKEYELSNDIDREHMKVLNTHLDHDNEHTFEIEDLRRLIKKTSDDLAEADRKRRAEFKEYEMQKEFEKESQLKEMNEEQRKTYEKQMKEQEQKHQKHEKVHHPGNKAQLEEVWEQQDHMDKQNFDPHAFFSIHDVDGNGVWDETEVKALFVKELDKVYQSGLPEDDMRERAEEMERMREHVFQETDANHDGLISFAEFLEQTKRDEFQSDPEWETVDQQKQYTHEEYLEFERKRQEEIQRLIAQGLLPQNPHASGYDVPQGGQYHDQQQMHYQQPGQQHMQMQQQYQQQQQQYMHQQQQQPVQLHPNQMYQQIPAQPQQQQQPQVPNYQPQQQQQQPPQVPNYQPQQQQPQVPNYQPQQQQPQVPNYQPQQQQPQVPNYQPQQQPQVPNPNYQPQQQQPQPQVANYQPPQPAVQQPQPAAQQPQPAVQQPQPAVNNVQPPVQAPKAQAPIPQQQQKTN